MSTKILIVDDSRFARRHLEQVLRGSGVCEEVATAGDGGEALEALRAGEVDLVLCDVLMPGVDGFEFLARRQSEQLQVPVIMLTSEGAVESKVKCLEAGASDYLVKPFHDAELVARVKLHLQLKTLGDELMRKNEELARLACIDPLTDISNRRHFMDAFERELSRAVRHGFSLTLGMIDIDHFKRINDSYGHQVGDEALVLVVRRLRQALRAHDLLGRYGGEEFAVVFVNAGPDAALAGAERCRRVIAAEELEIAGRRLPITVSIGVVACTQPETTSIDELIRQADEALYLAKRRGRNRVVVAGETPTDP